MEKTVSCWFPEIMRPILIPQFSSLFEGPRTAKYCVVKISGNLEIALSPMSMKKWTRKSPKCMRLFLRAEPKPFLSLYRYREILII